MKEIQRYIEESFGLSIKFAELTETEVRELPLYLKGGYELEKARLGKLKLIFARPKYEDYTPGQLEKQRELLSDKLSSIVVFVLNEIEPYMRRRLIGSGVAFIQIGKQLYIPELLLELSDIKKQYGSEESKKSHLSVPAQFAVLYHLEVGSIEEMPLSEIAKLLSTNAMAVSRIVKELDQHDIITIEGSRERQVCFSKKDKKQIWESVKNLMVSPVRKIFYTDYPLDSEPKAILCFDSALAKYSMISEGRQPSYAISRKDFMELEEEQNIPLGSYGRFRLEIWAYDASNISSKKIVDPLSLYLSMRELEDERVKMALEEMIDNIKW
ncbi:hypothetical protein [Pedobacter nutrimenti]|uniref:hypothetical protein n=1 Tax=Pedobacter nutrimenti TaxID=1241337 RepID=UPI00292F448D|nr:hypothetical protein [Pedobacter nutrimenti]